LHEVIKETPSVGRIVAMVAFALSVVGLLMFLWLSFGGSIPLRPQGYRVQVAFPEAATLAEEADVRLAGVNIGKVRSKKLDKGGARTIATLEIQSKYAPIPKDARAILRQKTLLGETYVQLSQGHKSAGTVPDGGRLANNRVEPTTELDEIFSAFDKPTRSAFQDWVGQLAKAIQHHSPGPAQDLNDALGNLPGFTVDGTKLLKVLDDQEIAVRGLVKNTGVVFGAINERQNALHDLILNANNTFQATQSRDQALAETFQIFPTFLDESKATLARLERFSRNTHPLVNDLKRPADDLGPTIRDLGDLSPDLERLFRNLNPLVRVGRTSVPELQRVIHDIGPVIDALHPFFQQLNPILSYLNFHQTTVVGFLQNGAPDVSGHAGGHRYQTNVGVIGPQSFDRWLRRPDSERGNAYMAPNALQRGIALGTIESFDCAPSGGEKRDPVDAESTPAPMKDFLKRPPCFVQPPSLYDGKQFAIPQKGVAPNKGRPGFRQGSNGNAVDPHPGDPLH
jgi:phospholipid/cholesterol/gamma-HCH transport system substrate-binding protein